jgi:Pectate lyase superfamily protein
MTSKVPFSMIDAQVYDPCNFGADPSGVADSTAAIQAAINAAPAGGTVYFRPGTYKASSQITVSSKLQLTLTGSRGAKLLFTEGAYIGLLFTSGAGQCLVENLMIHGTNNVNPALTLLKTTGNAAYLTVQNCQLSYASIGVMVGQSYIVKLLGNNTSNCDRAVYAVTSEGSNTDLLLQGETYGTNLLGTNPVLDIACPETRVVGCYFETQTQAKPSAIFRTGTQRAVFSGNQLNNSGEVRTETSNSLVVTGNTFIGTYSSANTRVVRIDGGSNAMIQGNTIMFASVVANVVGISCSGFAAVTGNYVSKCATGVSVNDGTVVGNAITGCTLGATASGANTSRVLGLNNFQSNTTDLDVNSGTNVVAFNFMATGAIGVATGSYFGNAPRQNDYKRATLKGATGSRPTLDATQQGVQYLDTTLAAAGKLITWSGTAWVDGTGTAV